MIAIIVNCLSGRRHLKDETLVLLSPKALKHPGSTCMTG